MKKRFAFYPEHGFIVLFGKLVWLPTFPRIRAFASLVRSFLPSAYTAEFYCCDSQKFYDRCVVFALNDSHFRKLEKDLDRASDGTRIRQVSLFQGFKFWAAA